VDYRVVDQLRQRVAAGLAEHQKADEAAGRPRLALADEKVYAQTLIRDALGAHAEDRLRAGVAPLDLDEEEALSRAVYDGMYKLGRLQRHHDALDYTDIHVNRFDLVKATLGDGSRVDLDPVADSDEELQELVRMAAARLGSSERRFDEGSAELDLTLPDGERLSAVHRSLAGSTALSIRRSRFADVTLADLRRWGTIDVGLERFFEAAVSGRKSIVIGGETGSGKTTFLRALGSAIGKDERIITVEKARELFFERLPERHPNVVALEARPPNTEGVGEVTLAQLVRRTLRMNPDRVIVGEVLGPEILDMLTAMSQGNEGSLSTIHAASSKAVFQRIATYALRSDEHLPFRESAALIAGAIDFVVFIRMIDERHRGGDVHRYVSSVREIIGLTDSGDVASNEVFQPRSRQDPRAVPGDPIRCIDDLVLHGYDPVLFDRAEGWWE